MKIEMINFEKLETDIDNLVIQYRLAKPFEHLVLDGYIDNVKLLKMYSEIPELTTKSRDFIFANEKYEKSKYYELGREFSELYEDLRSDRFKVAPKLVSAKHISNRVVISPPEATSCPAAIWSSMIRP